MYEMKGAWSCQDRRLGPGLGTDLPGSPAVFPASTRRPQNPGSYPRLYPQLVDSRRGGLIRMVFARGSGISHPFTSSPGSRAAQAIRRPGPVDGQSEPPQLLPARPAPVPSRIRGSWRILVSRARSGIPRGNKPENTIAPLCVKTYHGFMTTWQTLKRAGYMHPDSSLDAALFSNRCGVVAV